MYCAACGLMETNYCKSKTIEVVLYKNKKMQYGSKQTRKFNNKKANIRVLSMFVFSVHLREGPKGDCEGSSWYLDPQLPPPAC